MQGLRVLASTGQPGGDGGLTVAKDPLGGGRIQLFGRCREHHGDLLRGSFQPIERCVTSGREGGVTGRTSKGLDPLGTPMLAVADQGVEVSVSVAKVLTLRVRTSKARGIYAFRGSPPTLHLTPGTRHPQALALQPTRPGRRVDRRGNRRECGASADGGACCTWCNSYLEHPCMKKTS